ncbi:MAG TPA: acyl CoA:acetate/3-ketoacid CoA transferase, partial [Burkholderiales bacterium]|nr:acyl CoA:acetate/3-ketoacid CoA transferase [Burkholderiales bacterium]
SYTVKSLDDVEKIRSLVESHLAPLNKEVYAIVDYDHFTIVPDVLEAYSEMVKDLTERFYCGVTRYTTGNFLRVKLGDALQKRGLAPHIFESAEEARQHLRELEARVST